jgi:predicted unusual protein kinase regulating ubiquinone biosynthesis (AarF/ABC1/UbiB family)
MMGEITPSLRAGLRAFILAAVGRDGPGLVQAMQRLGVLLPTADIDELERAMSALFDRFGGMGVAELTQVDPRELEQFARRFSETVRTLPFQLPGNFLLLIRTVSLLSGVTSALNQDFNIWDAVDPFAKTLVEAGRSGGVDGLVELGQQAVGYASTLARLPRRLDQLAAKAERGDLAVRTPETDRRLRALERSIGRATSGFLFVGLLVGGAVLRASDDPLGVVLMIVAAVPLLHVVIGSRFP